MLHGSDSDAVKRWLTQALAPDRTPRITSTALAEHCDVTAQAVAGWRRTGRISKTNLAKAAQLIGSAPDFLHDSVSLVAREAPVSHRAAWPFDEIDEEAVRALTLADRLRLEGAVLVAATQLGLNIRRPKARAA